MGTRPVVLARNQAARNRLPGSNLGSSAGRVTPRVQYRGIRKMAGYQETIRAALWRNIERLDHLSEEQKLALLESETASVVARTDACLPLVEIYGHEEATDGDMDYEPEAPAEVRRPAKPAPAAK